MITPEKIDQTREKLERDVKNADLLCADGRRKYLAVNMEPVAALVAFERAEAQWVDCPNPVCGFACNHEAALTAIIAQTLPEDR